MALCPVYQLIDMLLQGRVGAAAYLMRLVAVSLGVLPVQMLAYFVCTGALMGLTRDQVRAVACHSWLWSRSPFILDSAPLQAAEICALPFCVTAGWPQIFSRIKAGYLPMLKTAWKFVPILQVLSLKYVRPRAWWQSTLL